MNCELEEWGYVLGCMNGENFVFRLFIINEKLYLIKFSFYYLGNWLNNRWWHSRSVQYGQGVTNLFGGGQEKDELVLKVLQHVVIKW